MGQEPDQIRRDIELKREEMGDTVDALSYKADVPTRMKESITGKRDQLRESITGATPNISGSGPDVSGGAKKAAGIAQENPLGLAIGGVALGFLAGLALPSTQMENEKIGPIADDVKQHAMDTGQEALEHGKSVAQDAAAAAAETAKESGQESADELKESTQDMVEQVRS